MSDWSDEGSSIEQPHASRTRIEETGRPQVHHSDLAALFDMQYPAIRHKHGAISRPGVLCFGFDLGDATLIGTHFLKARSGSIDAMTVGRHARCELSLPRDRELSLRHLCVLVHPLESSASIRFRVLDLRTSLGFSDCLGNRLQAVEADGPALIVIGRYALLLSPAGGAELPESASQAWDLVGDPLYLECKMDSGFPTWQPEAGEHLSSPPVSNQPPAISRMSLPVTSMRTSFTALDGPTRPAPRSHAEAQELGVLEVEASGEVRRLSIVSAEADRGLLIGSYQRCDDPCLTHVNHPAISRVHMLVIRCSGELYAIDTASSNGTFVEASAEKRLRTRVVRLVRGLELTLADSRVRLRWLPRQAP